MSLSTWPSANITSSPGFQLAGTALVAGVSLVQPARIPGYRFLRPLKAKIVAGVAIVAVLGIILLSPSADTNISTHDAALEDSITQVNQESLDRDIWKEDGRNLGEEDGYLAADLFDDAPAGDAGLFEYSMDKITPRLGLNSLYSTLHKTIAEPLRNLDAYLHEVSVFDDDSSLTSWSYHGGLDSLYHTLDCNNAFDWSIYDIISTLLFIRLYVGVVRWLCAFIFRRRAPVAPKPEVSLISDFTFAEPTARIERYVPELDASLRLFATISLERDGRPHSTGYIFDMYNDGRSHTGKLLVQRPALPDVVKSRGFQSFVQFLRHCHRSVVSFICVIQNSVVSMLDWCHGRFKAGDKVQREIWSRTLEQSFLEEGDTSNSDSPPGSLGLSDNGLKGLDLTGVVDIDESADHVLSDSECPPSPESRASYHSVDSTLADDDPITVQTDPENANSTTREIAKVDCLGPLTDTEVSGSSTEKLLRGATRAVDELLSSTVHETEKGNSELYKSMRIVKDLLAALSGQIASLDIPEDDYSHYLSDVEGQSDLEQPENMSCSELTLVTDTQSGFTYECTSHGDGDSLTLKFTVRDGCKEPSSSVPSGELSLIRKMDGTQASVSCTTVIATGPIFSPPFVQPSNPDTPMFVVIPGFRRQRKRPKNRSRGKGRARHNREAEDSTDEE